jgi:hypothetical protein
VQDDAHSVAWDDDGPQQKECDNIQEYDQDQHEAPTPDSSPEDPLIRSSRGHVPSTTYASDTYVVLLPDGIEPGCFSEAMKMRTGRSGIRLCKNRWIPCIQIILMRW